MRIIATIVLAAVSVAASATQHGLADLALQLSGVPSAELLEMSRGYIERGEADSALMCNSVVINRASGTDEESVRCRVTALANLGFLFMTSYCDFRKSYVYMLEAMDLAQSNGMSDLLALLYVNTAYLVYYDNILTDSIPEDVLGYYCKAFDCAYDAGATRILITAMSNLVEAGLESGDVSGVIERVGRFRELNLPDSIQLRDYIIMECDGIEAYASGEYELAARQFERAAQNVRVRVNYNQHKLSALACEACVYINTGQWRRAEAALLQGLPLAEEPQNITHALWLYNKLAKLYAVMGDTASVGHYSYRYLMLKDTLINKAQMGSTRYTQFQFYLDQANAEISQLNAERHQQRVMLAVSAAVVAVVAALLVGLFIAYKKIRQNYRALYTSSVKLLERERQLQQQRTASSEEAAKTGEATACEDAAHPKKHQQGWMTEDFTRELYGRVLNVFETSPEIYQTGFNIDRLSEIVGSRSRYVSQAINDQTGSNFNALLNRYRIIEACRLLNGKDGRTDYTVEALALNVGFKSRSGFSVIFKSITGLSPSVYQAMARDAKAKAGQQ